MKKICLLFVVFALFIDYSCTKKITYSPQMSVLELQNKRALINLQVTQQLNTSKKIIIQSIQTGISHRKVIQSVENNDIVSSKKVVYFNIKPIRIYYNSIFAVSTLKNASSLKTTGTKDISLQDTIVITEDNYNPNIGQGFNVYDVLGSDVVSEEFELSKSIY